jgi:myo-inositol 2-dehydrogenase / D-chiro-inositol 1-dehydrogenase
MDEVRFGVVGAGLMGQLHAANLTSRVRGARLVAIADIDPGSCASLVAAQPVEAVFEDYRRMLALAPIDAVVISTPPDARRDDRGSRTRKEAHLLREAD